MAELPQYIQKIENGVLYTAAPLSKAQERFIKDKGITELTGVIHDPRKISPNQRKKIFVLIEDIARFVKSFTSSNKKMIVNETLREMQLNYIYDFTDNGQIRAQLTRNYCSLASIELFSLSDTDMTTARGFISYLIELCIQHGIPCLDTLLNYCEDIQETIYLCLMYKKCCLCGQKTELHHVDTVGSGRNRKEIIHTGMRVLPLCRIHHTEYHTIGKSAFEKTYHISGGIKVNEEISKIYKLKVRSG